MKNTTTPSTEDETAKPSKPSLIARIVSWLHLKDDHDLLRLSITQYVPISVILNVVGVVVLVTVGFSTISEAFLTNVPLNGLIVTIMLIGVGMSIEANIRLWMTGLYLARLESITLQFRIRDEELDKVQKDLKKKASILDCKNMQNLLDNLKNIGSLNVNDNDARMIKSKVGARINRGRGKVTFLSGLLVMLGLLGTFLGLLGTIDAVGDAMAGMANIGSDSGDGGGISGFISSLAKPLDGMGLAFSSSLFGLSGSLLVGTFQYFSSTAQDNFIESFSRWLDEQIPGMDHANKAAKRGPNSPPVADAELKSWIVGFIQNSQNTQRELGGVIDAILVSADASRQAIQHSQSVMEQQSTLFGTLENLNEGVTSMIEHQQRLDSAFNSEFTQSLVASQQSIGDKLGAVDKQLTEFVGMQSNVVNNLSDLSSTLQDQIPRHVLQTSDRVGKSLARINDKMAVLSRQDQAHVNELAEQIQRLEKLVINSEKRTAQRDQKVYTELQNQFRRESDILKKTIGDNIASTVNKDVIPFIAKEQRELKKLAKIIDKAYGRRKDDKQEPDSDVA